MNAPTGTPASERPSDNTPTTATIVPQSQNEPILVSITKLRRDMARYFALAAQGRVVVITKEGIPFLQLLAVRYTFHPTDVLEQIAPPAPISSAE